MFSIKKGLCEDRPASLLVVSFGKAINGMASTVPLSGKTGSNRRQLDSKTEKVTSLSPDRGIWQINE